MQLNKNLPNLTDESKPNNSEFDNNSPNYFNVHISSNKINISNNEKSKEKENLIDNKKSSKDEKNKKDYIYELDKGDFLIHSPENNIFPINNTDNSKSKIDSYFSNNLIDTSSNVRDFENNKNDFDNDENFFNYSFYNNKNNNKIINNNFNYNNKLNENNEIKNCSSDEEQKNSFEKIQINPPSHTERTTENFPNLQNNEPYNDIENNCHESFSIENSNNNFKKKSRHNKQFKVRFGDWICPKCENLNFSFRNKCNRCGLSKEKIGHYNNSLQNQENNSINLNGQRPIMFNNININYIFNSNFPLNNINIIYNPILFNTNNINNYYGNYNNYQIYYPCNVNIK